MSTPASLAGVAASGPIQPVKATEVPITGSGPPAPVETAKPPPVMAKPRIDFDPQVVMRNISAAIEDLNKQLAKSGRNLGFSFDTVLDTPVVTVKNTATGEVVRQIPSEAVIKAAHTFETLKGLLHDHSS